MMNPTHDDFREVLCTIDNEVAIVIAEIDSVSLK